MHCIKQLLQLGCFLEHNIIVSPRPNRVLNSLFSPVRRERGCTPRGRSCRELPVKSWLVGGVLRVAPTFAVRDLGYDSNVFGTADNPVGDWHSTVAAGARFIVPVGAKVY